MIEDEWLAATDPKPMLEFLWSKASDRKLRLFGVACCRSIRGPYTEADHPSEIGLEVAERFVDGLADAHELASALDAVNDEDYMATDPTPGVLVEPFSHPLLVRAAELSSWWASDTLKNAWGTPTFWSNVKRQEGSRAHLLRDIFGNPFSPVTVDPAWLTSTVVALAEGIYHDRAFDRLPILADALMDAGCDNPDVLSHCRSKGPHVRGCWLIDLLTGRK